MSETFMTSWHVNRTREMNGAAEHEERKFGFCVITEDVA
jgi:hypothetical protein